MSKNRFKISVLLLFMASFLFVTGCCKRHNQKVVCEPQDDQSTEAVAPQAPQPEPVTYPIQEVVDGKMHSISVYPTGNESTGILLIERIAPVQVNLKRTFDYVINVTNISNNTLYDVTVTEPYSAIFEYESATPAPSSHQEGTLVWNLGNMDPKDTKSITMKGNAKEGGLISDCVTIAYTPRFCLDIEVVDPKLQLVQTGPETVIQCDPIPIVLTVKNNGTGIARNVVVREELPNGLLTLDGKNVIVAEAGDLQPGESKTVKVSLKASSTGTYETKAQAIGQGNLESSADYSVAVVSPVLVMTKTGPDERFAGRPATYDITITNKGDGPAKDLEVTDIVTAGSTFMSASDGGTFSDGKVVWKLGTLAPGASKKISVTLRLDTIGTVVNKATAKAYCASASAESTTKVVGIAAILLEVIDLEDPVEVGSNTTYVISVTNQGSAVGTNIRIVATLPDEQEYVTSSGPTRANVSGKVVTYMPVPRLEPKATVEYRVVVKGVKTGDLRFHVDLQSDQMTSPVNETESTHVY
jgi:uncharacterized repeat protein (TIGR01451 family)